MLSLLKHYDLLIAAGLVVIALLVFFLWRIGLLPRKSIPMVAGALLGGLGIVIFRERRARTLDKELKEVQERIRKREEELDRLQQEHDLTDREVAEHRAHLEEQIDALEKQIAVLRAQNAEERRRIDEAPPGELHDEAGRIGMDNP